VCNEVQCAYETKTLEGVEPTIVRSSEVIPVVVQKPRCIDARGTFREGSRR
jgi:hypothetical protein